MKRVLILNYEFPPLGGGAANANYYLLKEFSKFKYLQIDLVTSSIDKYKTEKFSDNITIHYLNIGKNKRNLYFQSNKNLLVYSIKALFYSWRLRLKNKYDLVHAWFGIPCGAIALLLFKPYIISLRGSDVPFYNKRFNFLDKYLFVYLDKLVWGRAKYVVANSEDLKKLAKKTHSRVDIKIIPNGVDTKFFKPNEKIKKEKAILFVGRLIERKRADMLIEAFANLPQKLQKEWEVWIVGEGPQKSKLKALAKSTHTTQRVKFLGRQDKKSLQKIYQKAEIYVLPSINEGMSNTLLEAMASGLPVVVTATGGADKLVSDNGLIIKETIGIRNPISKLIKNRDLRIKMGRKSALTAKSLDWSSAAEKYYSYY